MRRATSQVVVFEARDFDGGRSGIAANLSAFVSLDGGDFAAVSDTIVEIDETAAYSLTLTDDEMDASTVVVVVECSIDGVEVLPTVLEVEQSLLVVFFAIDMTTDLPAPGKTLTATVSNGGGAFGSSANSVAEIGKGAYKLTLSAAEGASAPIVARPACADSTVFLRDVVRWKATIDLSSLSAGAISGPVSRLRAMVAACATFQDWTSTADETAALSRVHAYDVDRKTATYPYAVVTYGDDLMWQKVAGGTRNWSRSSGSLFVYFVAAASGVEGSLADEFVQPYETTLDELQAQSGAGGKLSLSSLTQGVPPTLEREPLLDADDAAGQVWVAGVEVSREF